ncbi:PIN domain-containing protein [Streptomyces griseorubiginosus]|uniref:PIN domain-containing protein n=1 Tax=Streptomyces griseorubiginosus TaxID=67304 RepID=UPI0033A5589C
MIILDTSILRTFNPDSSSADLLRAIRTLDAERVAAPWTVLTELCAQQAIKYREQYEKAAQAVETLRNTTPWPLEVPLGPCDEDAFRDHWRSKWLEVVEEIPTSAEAVLQGIFRESNNLPPCRTVKGLKIGARDASIWLSAVGYAREHPAETVYFVSANTTDFGNGAPYPSPMSEDLVGLEGRFVHVTSMDEVAARFAEPTTIDEDYAVAMLRSPAFLDEVRRASREDLALPRNGSFSCTIAAGLGGERVVIPADGWITNKAAFGAVENLRAYRIGDNTWCTATVRWHLVGAVLTHLRLDEGVMAAGACSWTTSVLFTPRGAESRLTILRDDTPLVVSAEELDAADLDLPVRMLDAGITPVQATIEDLRRAIAAEEAVVNMSRVRGIPRAYEGAAMRRAVGRQARLGDISED